MSYSPAQTTTILRSLGFRIRTTGELNQAITVFQGGYNLGTWLKVDGKNGPLTSAALARSDAARRSGKGTASTHFSFIEFRCTCRGSFTKCRVILVRRELLQSLEKYRAKSGPVKIASGYRCEQRNQAVGGAASSQHMFGSAADVAYLLSDDAVAGLHAFSGIGRSASTHKVRHVDRRDASGHNLTHGSTTAPTVWNYAQ